MFSSLSKETLRRWLRLIGLPNDVRAEIQQAISDSSER